jgi:hypothetical protein
LRFQNRAGGRSALDWSIFGVVDLEPRADDQKLLHGWARLNTIGRQGGTKPGFYLMVGPNWKGDTLTGIIAVMRYSTRFAFAVPRIFMDDTPEDHRSCGMKVCT